MKGSSYRERDYAFGQLMLTKRTKLKLTQTELADMLGVRRRAVIDWEGGLNYPNVDHLKQFVVIAIERQAWSFGHEAEEVRALWQAARQKVLLDEAWLGGLLSHLQAPPASQSAEETSATAPPPEALASPSWGGPRLEWGDAPHVASFYGREWELDLLSQWVVQERCRVVSVLGQGGIGKSALATKVMHRVAERFEVVIWRSLRDVPTCEALLDSCLQVLAPQALRDASASPERRQDLLLECLRSRRILLVHDNLESVLEEGEDSGRMRAGYEGFSRLLRRVAETEHQSCLLLTSREKPGDLVPLEGNRAPVRALRLARLEAEACQHLLEEKDVVGSAADYARLVEAYAGNPLALKIVARTIVEIFGGQIAPFLEQGEVVFGGVRALLDEQFTRLSVAEQTVLLWLAIVREPVSMERLLALLVTPLSRAQMLEAIEALHHRSLIERGQHPGSFTLQSVVLEYATGQLLAEAASEIEQGHLVRLIEHGLELATVKEYIRQTQQRLTVAPLLAQVRSVYPERGEVEERLLTLLASLRARADYAQGYGPANLLALLRTLRGHMHGLDLSQLSIRGAFLQGVQMQDTSLAGATLHDTVFTESFDAIRAVAISPDGHFWAAGSRQGNVRVWRDGGKVLHQSWQAHTDTVRALAFSPDGTTLATGSWDGAIKLWDPEHGALLWATWLPTKIQRLAFAPDGRTLAGGGGDAVVRLWDPTSGALLQALPSQSRQVQALAWSPDGRLLASGGRDPMIWLWDVEAARYRAALHGPEAGVDAIAFTPDSHHLLSGSDDGTLRLWDVEHGLCVQSLQSYAVSLYDVAWSPDGTKIASAGTDTLVTIWDVENLTLPRVLRGHSRVVHGVAWSPDGKLLASSGWDSTIRIWDATTEASVQILQDPDHVDAFIFGVDWSPNGKWLAGASTIRGVQVWEVNTGVRRWFGQTNSSTTWVVWSPDGSRLASCSDDGSVCLWDAASGILLLQLTGHQGIVKSVAWSLDGNWLASGGGSRDGGELFVWDAHSGERVRVLSGHPGIVYTVAWSPTCTVLVSGGSDGRLRWWDRQNGECVRECRAHQGTVQRLQVSPDGSRLASCGDDGAVMLWDLHSGEHLRTLRRDRPYERLNIIGIRGVTEAQKASLLALGAIEDDLSIPV